jgi:predicted RNase H-like HicB family nuclease
MVLGWAAAASLLLLRKRKKSMLQYKAGYKFVAGGVHAQVLDFPGAITCGSDLAEARALLAVALVAVAETLLERGDALPVPHPELTDVEMDFEEPIYLEP